MKTNPCIHQNRRRGMTLLEVLVVIGVIGLLASLLLPAVMTSRATSQRLRCVNNLKQIALAGQNFESVHGVLPGASETPLTDLLPHLEQPDLKAYVFSQPILPHVLLPVVLCPASDVLPHDFAPVHYAQNHGSDLSRHNGLAHGAANPLRSRDVTDGLSMTAIFAEKPQVIPYEPSLPDGAEVFEAECRRDPIRCIWHLKGSYSTTDAPEAFARACQDASQRTGVLPPAPVGHHQLFICPQATYGHYIPPNTPGCFFEDPTYPIAHAYTAWSRHAGGVNVALCDGSARFVSNAIGLSSWQALGSRNGNDHVDEF